MEKGKLELFINKYNLAGNCEEVLWDSDGTDLSVRSQPSSKDVIAEVKLEGIGFPQGSLAVTDTKRLKAILGVLGDNVTVTPKVDDSRTVGISLTDGDTKAYFAVGLPAAVPPVQKATGLPPMDTEILLDEDFTTKFLRAKAALSDVSTVTFMSDGTNNTLEVILGFSKNNTNKITFEVSAPVTQKIPPVHFSANYLKDIIISNKDISTGKLNISSKGLAVANFVGDDCSSKYYLLAVEIQ